MLKGRADKVSDKRQFPTVSNCRRQGRISRAEEGDAVSRYNSLRDENAARKKSRISTDVYECTRDATRFPIKIAWIAREREKEAELRDL